MMYTAAYIFFVVHVCQQYPTCLLCRENDHVWFNLYSCWDKIVLPYFRITHIYMLWIHKNSFMVSCFIVWVARIESYILYWLVLQLVHYQRSSSSPFL